MSISWWSPVPIWPICATPRTWSICCVLRGRSLNVACGDEVRVATAADGDGEREGAVDALQACQPYTMLPPDRYGEWNVLDLTFTPQDFSSPS